MSHSLLADRKRPNVIMCMDRIIVKVLYLKVVRLF